MSEPKYKGKFEPKIAKIFEGLEEEYGFTTVYEPKSYSVRIPQLYTPDFELKFSDGRVKVFETKGYFRYEDQRKVLAFRNDYPGIQYHIVFERNNPIRKNSKLTYMDWAAKHGIPAAVGEVPKEWLK